MTALKGGRAKRKVSLAIGGWNDSKGDKYSRLVNDPKARRYVPRIYLLEDCYSSSQSAPTFLVYQVDLIFFEGLDLEKAGCKKQGHCYSKREESAWLLLFLNNNDPVFSTLLFATHILDLFYRVTN